MLPAFYLDSFTIGSVAGEVLDNQRVVTLSYIITFSLYCFQYRDTVLLSLREILFSQRLSSEHLKRSKNICLCYSLGDTRIYTRL